MTYYGPMPIGGTSNGGARTTMTKATTGGIDSGFPTGGKAALGGQATVDYGVLPVGGSAIIAWYGPTSTSN
jgi:hypothetical protein